MPATRTETKSIHLIGGNDEFTIKETARKLAEQLAPKNAGEFGLEIIEGETSNQDLALQVIARLTEALNTLPFFGGEKLVWLKSTDLLADSKTTQGDAVKNALIEFGELLKRGLPDGVTSFQTLPLDLNHNGTTTDGEAGVIGNSSATFLPVGVVIRWRGRFCEERFEAWSAIGWY